MNYNQAFRTNHLDVRIIAISNVGFIAILQLKKLSDRLALLVMVFMESMVYVDVSGSNNIG